MPPTLMDVQSLLMKRVPGYWSLRTAWKRRFDPHSLNPFITFAPPGHFYSPIPELQFVERHWDRIFKRNVEEIPGIALRRDEQLALVEELARYYPELPFRAEATRGLRYWFDNIWFSYADAIILYALLRHGAPATVLEVGSGFSSALMLDTNDLFLDRRVSFTFIEPFPERLNALLTDADRRAHEIVVDIVQNVPVERFARLQAGDILFIDSSHVAKIGSDVVYLISDVLPALNPGVLVHFHDVFWPFEYPESFVRTGRAWNEIYMLKAFLQFNDQFEILCFNSWLGSQCRAEMTRHMPLFLKNPGGSLWLRKRATS